MFTTSLTIEWGDCDEAGIVFYPNYFYWFDSAFQRLLRARGLSQRILRARFGAVTPIVQAHADFMAPARYDDELQVDVEVSADGERRFKVGYRLTSGERTIALGHEIRAWALTTPDGALRGARIDPAFLDLLRGDARGMPD